MQIFNKLLLLLIVVFAILLSFEKFSLSENKNKSSKATENESPKISKKDAKEFINHGMELFDKGDYEGALAYFQKAGEVKESAQVIFMIAKCYDSMYKFRDAYEYYKKYLGFKGKEKKNEKEAQEAIARIEGMSVILKVITEPSGAKVFLDGNEVTFQQTPVVTEVKGGKKVEVKIKKEGFEDYVTTVEIPFGGESRVEAKLVPLKGEKKGASAPPSAPPAIVDKLKKEEEIEESEEVSEEAGEKGIAEVKVKKKFEFEFPAFVFSLAGGASVSTSENLASYPLAGIGVHAALKDGLVGISLDNFIFSDSYILSACLSGGYRLKIWRDLSAIFLAGIGGIYMRAFDDGYNSKGEIVVSSGNHGDLAVHGEGRIRYKLGPVFIEAIPLHVTFFTGIGSIDPAPLAQFSFLAGVGYDLP